MSTPPERASEPQNATAKVRAAAVAVVLLLLVGLAGVAELALRRVVTLPMRRPIPQVRYDVHPTRRFTLRPDQVAYSFDGRVTVGPDGLRTHGGAHRDSAATVVLLGDSFVFGMGVDDSATFPAQLERELRARGLAVRTINAGVISYSPYQELDLLREKGLDASARVIIHGLYWNDYLSNDPAVRADVRVLADDGLFVWDAPERRGGLRDAVAALGERSALLFTLRRSAAAIRAALAGDASGTQAYERTERDLESGVVDRAGFASVWDFYTELRALAAARGFTLYAVVMPVHGIVDAPAPADHPYARFVRQSLDSLGIPAYDAHVLWQERGAGSELFLPYNKHLSAAGNALLAEGLGAWLAARPEWQAVPAR